MWVKEKFYRSILKKKLIFLFKIILIYVIFIDISFADLQKNLINKITATRSLSFNFEQKIAEKVEFGKCYIKYPLLMKCIYQNSKQKSVISNGRTVAIIKKKYKKIYYYPIKATPLFTILKKEKILDMIRNNKPTKIDSSVIKFELIEKKLNKLKIIFDKNSLELKGWEIIDSYSNNVSFIINNLKTNEIIEDDFFKIPKEEDL
jgi:outer membrane lipoprotein-sorting protein